MKKCVLEPDKDCNDCGDCNFCDLNPFKVCDNCCRCLDGADYRGIEVTKIILPDKLETNEKKKK